MKLYTVVLENKAIYGIYSSRKSAQNAVTKLKNIYYENAIIQEHNLLYR